MASTRDEQIQELIDRANEDEFQNKLKPGFQRSFISSVSDQWGRTRSLSGRQEEVLRDLVEQVGPITEKKWSRRYE